MRTNPIISHKDQKSVMMMMMMMMMNEFTLTWRKS